MVNSQSNKAYYLSDKFLLWSILLLFGVMSLSALIFGNGTFVDVMRGYVSMDQFLDGEAFNTLNYNLASGKVSYFIAWWTPGQYLLPYSLKLLGLPLWFSQGIWIVLFTGLSLLGYYRLFQHFGFSKNRSLLSVLIIQTNQLFFWNTILYYGGSLFEIGILPWFILFLLKIKSPFSWKESLMYILVALGLFFFKATFLLHAGIGLAVLLLGYKKLNIKNIAWIFFSGLVVLAICYFGFLQFGETPSGTKDLAGYNNIPNSYVLDFMTPLTSLFGIFSNLSVILFKLLPYGKTYFYVVLAVFPILTFLGIWLLIRVYSLNENARKLVQFTLLFFICFWYFFFTDKAISYDFRHFGPLAFCFVPFGLDEIQKMVKREWVFTAGINILLIFNLILFGLERVGFSYSMQNLDGLYVSDSDFRAYGNMKRVRDLSPKDATYVIKDSWGLMYHLKGKNRIPIMHLEGKWVVKSGIEIANPKSFNFPQELKDIQNLVVFIPGFRQNLPSYLTGFEWKYPHVELDRYHTIFVGKKLP